MRNVGKNKKKYWRRSSRVGDTDLSDSIQADLVRVEASNFSISNVNTSTKVLEDDHENLKRIKTGKIQKRLRKQPTFYSDAIPDDIWAESGDGGSKGTKKMHPSWVRKVKESALPTPHPGISYNPSLVDHRTLLKEVYDDEEKKLRAENKVKRQLEDFFPSAEDAPTEETYFAEMSGGIFEVSEEENSGVSDDGEPDGEVAVHLMKALTKKERSRTKKNKLDQEKEMKKRKAAKKLRQDLSNIPTLMKEIKQKQAVDKEKRIRLKRLNEKRGKPEVNQPFLLSAELPGSLRRLKAEGDPFADRLRSYHNRGILPRPFVNPRTRKERKRYKGIEKKD